MKIYNYIKTLLEQNEKFCKDGKLFKNIYSFYKYKIFLISLFVLIYADKVYSQVGENKNSPAFFLKVIDSEDKPIPFASIQAFPTKTYTYTDSLGVSRKLISSNRDSLLVVSSVEYVSDTFFIDTLQNKKDSILVVVLEKKTTVLPIVKIERKAKMFVVNRKMKKNGFWGIGIGAYTRELNVKYLKRLCPSEYKAITTHNPVGSKRQEICTYLKDDNIPFNKGSVDKISFFYKCTRPQKIYDSTFKRKNAQQKLKIDKTKLKKIIVKIYMPEENYSRPCTNELNLVPGRLVYTKEIDLPIRYRKKKIVIDISDGKILFTKKGLFIGLETISSNEEEPTDILIGTHAHGGFVKQPLFVKNKALNQWVNITKMSYIYMLRVKKTDIRQGFDRLDELEKLAIDRIFEEERFQELLSFDYVIKLTLNY